MKILICGLAAGVGFGALTSLVNAVSSPYTEIGMPLTGTAWAGAAEVLSLLLDAGWSWAALGVAMGWWAGAPSRGALVGVVTLGGATMGYYTTDKFAFDAGTNMTTWLVAGIVFGLVLGTVGAAARRPGLVGLLAALTVPVGAAVQMIVLPPRPHLTLTPPVILAEVIVWTIAVIGAVLAVYRFWAGKRSGTEQAAQAH